MLVNGGNMLKKIGLAVLGLILLGGIGGLLWLSSNPPTQPLPATPADIVALANRRITPEPQATLSPPVGTLKTLLINNQVLPTPEETGHSLWQKATPLQVKLGTETLNSLVELRAISDGKAIVFLARWQEEETPPPTEVSASTNKFTIFWRLDEQFLAKKPGTCHTSCHTAYSTGNQINRFNLSAIESSGKGGLNGKGVWAAGNWTVSWSRPLINYHIADVQFDDTAKTYLFRVEIYPWLDRGVPLVSKRYAMIFELSNS
jgi:hypothetical protein